MASAVTAVVLEIEKHVAAGGWDQPPRLFALAGTAELARREPSLADQLAVGLAQADGSLTPIEQDALPADRPLDEVLGGIGWPVEVVGAALAVERFLLPAGAEAGLPDASPNEQADWVAAHPAREEVRIVVGVLRDGARDCALRLRAQDSDDAVLTGPDLVPGLVAALRATLED